MSQADRTQKIVDSQGNTVAWINPNYVDVNQFGLNLFGENTTELSAALNENFIRLSQHLYSETQPPNPIIGQTWFNKDDNITYQWLGKNWVQTDKDSTYDSFMFVKYDVDDIQEFVLDEFVFNFTINNIKLYNQDMNDVKFIIDSFDSRKIILRESNVTTLYIVVFHPKDRISNPFVNRRMEIFTTSGQTQFDIDSFLDGSDINTLSVSLNGVMMRNSEFYVSNNVLNIDGMIYRVRQDDKLTVWLYGGSRSGYYSNFKIHTSRMESFLRVPKFFKEMIDIQIIDVDNKVSVNPIETIEYDDYYHFEFLDSKNVIANVNARII